MLGHTNLVLYIHEYGILCFLDFNIYILTFNGIKKYNIYILLFYSVFYNTSSFMEYSKEYILIFNLRNVSSLGDPLL